MKSPGKLKRQAQYTSLKIHELSNIETTQYLRINKRTLENWQQGRTKPNAQAAALIKKVEKYPDTLSRLAIV